MEVAGHVLLNHTALKQGSHRVRVMLASRAWTVAQMAFVRVVTLASSKNIQGIIPVQSVVLAHFRQ